MRREQALDEQRFASGESDLSAARPRTPRKGIPSRLQIGRPAHGSFQARSGGALPRSFRSRNDRKGLGTTDNGTIFAFRRYSAARSGWVSRMAALLLHLPC